jgi:DNA mismatch endonuclease (patch repair protein)
MADVLTPEQRRLNMSRIRGSNTKPERHLRSALHSRGLRFRVHRRDLPGCPDIVFPRSRIAIFVDGCFWHGCPLHGAKPKTNEDFWNRKLLRNRERDREVLALLRSEGWKVLRYWEHEIERNMGRVVRAVVKAVSQTKRRPSH